MKKVKIALSLCFACALFLTSFFAQPKEALADTGTCCYPNTGICIVGEHTIPLHYYLQSGPCPDPGGGGDPGGGDPGGGEDPIIKM